MENAKKELLNALKDRPKVKCAWIGNEETWDDDGDKYKKLIELKTNHSKEDFNSFLESLNFDYDDGYGGQELYGYVWFKDGTWLERGEYDGSEWWNYNKVDKVPLELQG